jgi:hypothetical protein
MDSTITSKSAADPDEINEIYQPLSPKTTDYIEISQNTIDQRYNEYQNQEHNTSLPASLFYKKASYNEYVNHSYEEKNGKQGKCGDKEKEEEAKPLLKSIVKSTSANVHQSLSLNRAQSKNKRLSWQADPTRHTSDSRHHVQFNYQNQEGNEINTQSTSLDSSDEGVTQNDECDCPTPITNSSSSSSDEDEEFSEIQAPDGGWGWVVVFAAFMVNCIADGITFSFGIFNVEFLKYFGDSKGKLL